MGNKLNLERTTPRACTGPGRAIALGMLLLAATGSSVPAYAQDSYTNSDPITVVGRARAASPSVFGTVAVPFGTTPMSARWTRVLSSSVNDARLLRLTATAQTYSSYQKAAFVQSLVNRGVRNHSRPKCNDDGYWAAAKESLARGIGDCVDIAIAKMEALRQLGFAGHDLYLTTGRTPSSSGLEAALLVKVGTQFYLLDARSDMMVEAGSATWFTPIVTYGIGMTWAHGVPVSNPRTLSKPRTIAQASDSTVKTSKLTGLDSDLKSAIRALTPAK